MCRFGYCCCCTVTCHLKIFSLLHIIVNIFVLFFVFSFLFAYFIAFLRSCCFAVTTWIPFCFRFLFYIYSLLYYRGCCCSCCFHFSFQALLPLLSCFHSLCITYFTVATVIVVVAAVITFYYYRCCLCCLHCFCTSRLLLLLANQATVYIFYQLFHFYTFFVVVLLYVTLKNNLRHFFGELFCFMFYNTLSLNIFVAKFCLEILRFN